MRRGIDPCSGSSFTPISKIRDMRPQFKVGDPVKYKGKSYTVEKVTPYPPGSPTALGPKYWIEDSHGRGYIVYDGLELLPKQSKLI